MVRTALLVTVLAALLVACGNDAATTSVSSQPMDGGSQVTEPGSAEGGLSHADSDADVASSAKPGWAGPAYDASVVRPRYRDEYSFAYRECRDNTEGLYREAGTRDPAQVAEYVAAGLRPGWREASLMACAAGFQDR